MKPPVLIEGRLVSANLPNERFRGSKSSLDFSHTLINSREGMLRPFAKDLFYPAQNNFAGIFRGFIEGLTRCSAQRKSVFLLIDGFGRDQIETQREQCDALVTLCENSSCELSTSQFPSTTTAHVTTACFNMSVGEHGLYEWQIYEPLSDALLKFLPYRTTGGEPLPPVDKVLPFRTVFQELSNLRVTSTIVSPSAYLQSPYNEIAARGANYVGYDRENWREALSSAIGKMRDQSYLYFYYPYIDEAGHDYGPESAEVRHQVAHLCEGLVEILDSAKVDWLLTADHGMVSVDPRRTIRLDKECPWLLPLLRTNREGKCIGPAGSERDLFIHTAEPEMVSERLQSHLEERAEVRTTEEMIRLGFFGEHVSERFRARVGDVVVLPVEGESVWMMEDLTRLGQHGGLTRKEMEICVFRNAETL